jgi:hypothetical protein
LEDDPKVQAFFRQSESTDVLQHLANLQREAFAVKKVSNPASNAAKIESSKASQIQILVKGCEKVPLFPGERSGYKDLQTTLARVCLGEILCEVFLQSSCEDLGISPKMLQAGLDCIVQREQTIHSKAAHSKSKGSSYGKAEGRHLRPLISDFWRCGLTAMCKNADSWREQAAFTNFVASFIFSILKGVQCGFLDNLELSEVDLLSSQSQNAESVTKTGTDEEGAAIARSQVPEKSGSVDVAENSQGKTTAVKQPVKNAAVKREKKNP